MNWDSWKLCSSGQSCSWIHSLDQKICRNIIKPLRITCTSAAVSASVLISVYLSRQHPPSCNLLSQALSSWFSRHFIFCSFGRLKKALQTCFGWPLIHLELLTVTEVCCNPGNLLFRKALRKSSEYQGALCHPCRGWGIFRNGGGSKSQQANEATWMMNGGPVRQRHAPLPGLSHFMEMDLQLFGSVSHAP